MQKNTNQQPKRQRSISDFAKYSSMAFQMIAIILVGVLGGMKLDKIFSTKFHIFTIVLTILGVIISIYYVIRDLLRHK